MRLDECRRNVLDWIGIKLTTGRCSALLVEQLACHMQNRTLDVFAIYDEIGALEGAALTRSRSTKPASMFKGAVLSGLWHKHYATPKFIPHNLINHWTPARLEGLRADVESDADVPIDQKAEVLAYRMVMEGHRERHEECRVTGEWIVYAKGEAGNRYLTLARHGEADEAIRTRADQAAAEFSELKL
jgi:hypothetical protein